MTTRRLRTAQSVSSLLYSTESGSERGVKTMGDMTTIGEILEFAIGREAEAVEFYMAMADIGGGGTLPPIYGR